MFPTLKAKIVHYLHRHITASIISCSSTPLDGNSAQLFLSTPRYPLPQKQEYAAASIYHNYCFPRMPPPQSLLGYHHQQLFDLQNLLHLHCTNLSNRAMQGSCCKNLASSSTHPFGIILRANFLQNLMVVECLCGSWMPMATVFSKNSTLDSIILVVTMCNNPQSSNQALIPVYRTGSKTLTKGILKWKKKIVFWIFLSIAPNVHNTSIGTSRVQQPPTQNYFSPLPDPKTHIYQ